MYNKTIEYCCTTRLSEIILGIIYINNSAIYHTLMHTYMHTFLLVFCINNLTKLDCLIYCQGQIVYFKCLFN